MKQPVTDPQLQFQIFDQLLSAYPGFTRKPVPGSGYQDWEEEGMHDPPAPVRRYSTVKRRIVFFTQAAQSNFCVQLDLLERKGRLLAAVFLRAEDYPKEAVNTANATFKFRWDKDHEAYCVDFNSAAVKRSLNRTSSNPSRSYIKICPGKPSRVLLGADLNNSLVHSLLLITDYAGQCGHGTLHPRIPTKFHPPATGSGNGTAVGGA